MEPTGWVKIVSVVVQLHGSQWSFYGIASVGLGLSLGMTLAYLVASPGVVAWIFRTAHRPKFQKGDPPLPTQCPAMTLQAMRPPELPVGCVV